VRASPWTNRFMRKHLAGMSNYTFWHCVFTHSGHLAGFFSTIQDDCFREENRKAISVFWSKFCYPRLDSGQRSKGVPGVSVLVRIRKQTITSSPIFGRKKTPRSAPAGGIESRVSQTDSFSIKRDLPPSKF
ncbi:MAG: hypothetical protein O7G86_07715, partial [Gammaproteobacteria bacterium]|nr:hypothetical protein [Gammaproteobacteria bacterium]